jgi:hypothetical protein
MRDGDRGQRIMDRWPHNVGSHNIHAILRAVKDEAWQRFRLLLKGQPTFVKLERLESYRLAFKDDPDTQIRVDNYINALKRGGQLDMDLRVTERP